ncbi:MAG: hypothetical protein Q8R83_03420 [Legionellaceae bacterium]|nr:hypothetical protein [Legionellaceae bacterium]
MSDRLVLTELQNPLILNQAKALEGKGWIEQTEDYCYLKITDDYIHSIHPILTEYHRHIEKPDYFNSPDAAGAHISVIYPEEKTIPYIENIGQIHTFQICKLIKAQYDLVEYYVLSITSSSLAVLRQTHHLSAKPVFKGHEIMFHITIGVRRLSYFG